MLGDATGGTPADDLSAAFEQFSAAVYRVCRARTANVEEAQDAMQETFLRLLQADRTRIENMQAWLIAVAMKVCSGIQGVRLRREETELPDEHAAGTATDPAEPALDAAWVESLARRLRPVDYQVLHMLYVTGLSPEQVAERLGVTVGNARIMAFRARKHLRELHDMFGIGLDLLLFLNPLMLVVLGSNAPPSSSSSTVIRQRRPLRSPPGCRVVRHHGRQRCDEPSSETSSWQWDRLR